MITIKNHSGCPVKISTVQKLEPPKNVYIIRCSRKQVNAMALSKLCDDSGKWYMNELTSQIVAESGIPTDRYHIGKIILHNFRSDPDFLLQIDGATGEEETFGSVLERSVRCANCFRKLGLQTGDVIILMAPNHVDITVPFYAALYLGVIVAAIDRTLTTTELRGTFGYSYPKIIFCQSERAPDVQLALNELNMDTKIVTFDKGDYLCHFSDFLEENGGDTNVEEFRPNDFDAETTIAFLVATSGTTGLPKAAAVTHKNFVLSAPNLWLDARQFPTPTRLALVCSPLQWLTALLTFLGSAIMKYTRLQTSVQATEEHVYNMINTYRPTFMISSPTMMTALLKPDRRDLCDFSSFECIMLGGSAVPQDLVDTLKSLTPNGQVRNIYGMSELAGICFYGDSPAPGSCGKPMGCFQYRLVNIDTQEDIDEPNVPGELWLKGPTIFKEYYNNPEATEETFAEDRWFKTGDLFYRDENWNFFFVERFKLLLKYMSCQISPVELENVIRQHPAVLDVAVTGIPDPACGDLPVACVVRQGDVSAQDIKNIIKDNLSDAKQLRGGVIFVDAIPLTPSTKVHRRKLREMVLVMPRE